MPTPQTGETRDEFIERCIPIVIDDGTAEDGEQAVAVCHSMWNERDKAGGRTMEMERKTFSAKVIGSDEKTGIVDTIFAVFGNIDQGDDVIHPGAFTKTFAERGRDVLVLDSHNTNSIKDSLGKPLSFKEIGRDELPSGLLREHPDVTGGAFSSVQFNMKTDEGRGAFHRLDAGDISKWSFGYEALDFDFSKMGKDGEEITVRNLRTIKLFEISPCLFAMNEATTTTATKGANGKTGLPIAARDRPWSASAAAEHVRSETGSVDAPSETYRDAFFWFNGAATDLFGSYKLPFADVIGGDLTAIPRGIFAGAQRLDAADIPAADKTRIQAKISTYYRRMREQFDDDNIVPSWDKLAIHPTESKAINLQEQVGSVIDAFYMQFPDVHGTHNRIVYWVDQVWDEFIVVRQEGTEGNHLWKVAYTIDDKMINFALPQSWIEGMMTFTPLTNTPAIEQAARKDDTRAGPAEPPTLETDRLKLLLEIATQI